MPQMFPSSTLRLIERVKPHGFNMDERSQRMVWIDLEMTGLDIESESIIEIATVITDGELNILAQGPNLAISVNEELLANMDEWNTSHHNQSGLVERVRNNSVSLEEAERQTLEFISKWVDQGVAPLCGNSIWNDRKFMEKEMKQLVNYLHYRMIDVSTIKELSRRWYPQIEGFQKKGCHLALDDSFTIGYLREILKHREIDIQFYFYLITIGLLWPSLVEGVNLFEVLEYSDYSIKVIMYDAKGGM
jgi:oligoribonuclease